MPELSSLEQSIDYYFTDIKHLQEALSHPSLKQHHGANNLPIIDNERYEILGDAIVSLLVVELLLERFPRWPEGKIAKLKAYIVSTEVLSRAATEIKLGEYLIMTKGEEATGGRLNPANLENAFEALVAAIYIDSKQPLISCRKLLQKYLGEYLRETNLADIDPKTTLQEYAQKNKQQATYRKISSSGAAHSPTFEVEAIVGARTSRAKAGSVKAAEKLAAKSLLATLKNLQ